MLTINLDKALKDLSTNTDGRTDYRVFMCIAQHMNDEGVSAVPPKPPQRGNRVPASHRIQQRPTSREKRFLHHREKHDRARRTITGMFTRLIHDSLGNGRHRILPAASDWEVPK